MPGMPPPPPPPSSPSGTPPVAPKQPITTTKEFTEKLTEEDRTTITGNLTEFEKNAKTYLDTVDRSYKIFKKHTDPSVRDYAEKSRKKFMEIKAKFDEIIKEANEAAESGNSTILKTKSQEAQNELQKLKAASDDISKSDTNALNYNRGETNKELFKKIEKMNERRKTE